MSSIASESGRPQSPAENHVGLGHEPVTVVGRMRSAVAVNTLVLLHVMLPRPSVARSKPGQDAGSVDTETYWRD
jgi:hypothetical protein